MRLFSNMTLKLLAIIFAMLLWFHVATNQEYDQEILYTISYVNIPSSLVMASASDNEVAVHMRGSGKGLMRLMWGERRWPIDLSRAKVGTQQIHILADNIPLYGIKDLSVLGLVDSDTLTVILDSSGQKTVPVRSSVEIAPTAGFVCSTDPILTPDSVVLTGPRTNLERVEEVWTQPDLIKDVRDPVERLLSLLPAKSYGVTMNVDHISLYQKVEPYLTRAFSAVPVQVTGRHESEGLDISPSYVIVEVAGPQSAVVQLIADSINVSCEPLLLDENKLSVRTKASVPSPLRVLKLSPDSVTVERHERTRADSGD